MIMARIGIPIALCHLLLSALVSLGRYFTGEVLCLGRNWKLIVKVMGKIRRRDEE